MCSDANPFFISFSSGLVVVASFGDLCALVGFFNLSADVEAAAVEHDVTRGGVESSHIFSLFL